MADDSIILKGPILGNTFLYENSAIIDYSSSKDCNITASLYDENNNLERIALQVTNGCTNIHKYNKNKAK